MGHMDRELGLAGGGDLPTPDARFRDRLLLLDEMEETAQAIRARAAGFDDVAEDQVRRLEAAMHAMRAGVAPR
jgi:hypothetical protein